MKRNYTLCDEITPHPPITIMLLSDTLTTVDINDWLLEHGAVEWNHIHRTTGIVFSDRYIDFYDDELYTMFKLRWG